MTSFTLRFCAVALPVLLFSSACTLSHSKIALSPEDLLANSAEVVSFPISDTASLHTISAWIADDLPSHATLSCSAGNAGCTELTRLLNEKHIPTTENAEATDKVALSYDHITTRECPTYAFGCSVSVNSLHMIGNYNQILKPATVGSQDAASAVDAYKRAHSDAL